VKVSGFPARYNGFDGKNYIYEWKFTAINVGNKNEAVVPAPLKPETPPSLPVETIDVPKVTPPEEPAVEPEPVENPPPPSEEPASSTQS
jgi:hypothetical protein